MNEGSVNIDDLKDVSLKVLKRLKSGITQDEILSVLFELTLSNKEIDIKKCSIEWLCRKISKELQLNTSFSEISEWVTQKDGDHLSILEIALVDDENAESLLIENESFNTNIVNNSENFKFPLLSYLEEDIVFLRYSLNLNLDEISNLTNKSRPTIIKKNRIALNYLKNESIIEANECEIKVNWIKI